ncbi:helix-turn-helix domain-containing protein [Vagococcus sp. BWB3-3]|uniref:Helix-turn-helix domain-containing protein n=1 Tax=Vagococcus allomyrinae TaxID=2794353 RepID=A0A940SVK3_9ENTE|nr:helix-turn-helix domain-containing protein [Vagococcus allomyrinae]MBP1041156.1 helix-turn-helix domain-containing protein [Vagococcus allomyrinae]
MHHKLQQLVTNKHQVLLHMIAYISEEERWYSVQEISQEIGLVERSVQRYTQLLYDLIAECNEANQSYFVLQMKKNRGVKLLIKQPTNVQCLTVHIYESDNTVKLLIDLLFGSYNSTQEYVRKKDLNAHSVRQSLSKIKAFLHTVELDVSVSGFRLLGDESQIRMIGYSLSWMLFQSEPWPEAFHKVDPFKINSAIDSLITTLHLDISHVRKRKLSYMVAINILRLRRGETVCYRADWEPYVPVDNMFELNKAVENLYQTFHIYSHEEVRFLVLNIMMKSFVYKVPHFKKKILENHRSTESDVLTLTNLAMREFDEKMCPIIPEDYESIYLYLFRSHLSAKVYKQADFDYSGHSFMDSIYADFVNYHERMTAFIHQLWLISQNSLFLEERYLIQVYIMVVSYTQMSLIFEPPLKISLQTDLSDIHEMRIREFICEQFKNNFNLKFLETDHSQIPDLILTNLTTNIVANSTMVIDYPLSHRDLFNLKTTLSKLKKQTT